MILDEVHVTYSTTIKLSIFNAITISSGSEICNPLLEKLATFCSQNQRNATSESLNYKTFPGEHTPGPP